MGALGRKQTKAMPTKPDMAELRYASRAEFQRRVKNILAVMRLLQVRTAESYDEISEFLAHYTGRFDALARVLNAFSRGDDEGIDLEEMVREELLAQAAADYQFQVDGPPVWLRYDVAQILALAVHELVVNAVKFGALGVADGGRLTISWRVTRAAGGDFLHLDWREAGVPAIEPAPQRSGMGRDLIERGLPYELKAATALDFAPGGLRCSIIAPCGENIWEYAEEAS